MAMVYTLAMQLKESLTELLMAKAIARELEDQLESVKVQEVNIKSPPPSLRWPSKPGSWTILIGRVGKTQRHACNSRGFRCVEEKIRPGDARSTASGAGG